jgi:hypothetical protein
MPTLFGKHKVPRPYIRRAGDMTKTTKFSEIKFQKKFCPIKTVGDRAVVITY